MLLSQCLQFSCLIVFSFSHSLIILSVYQFMLPPLILTLVSMQVCVHDASLRDVRAVRRCI